MAGALLQRVLVRDFAFAQPSASGVPRHSHWTYGIAAVVHVVLFALLIHVKTPPRRVSSAGSPYGSMTAYVAGPIAAVQTAAPSKPVEPKKTALTTRTATAVPKDD